MAQDNLNMIMNAVIMLSATYLIGIGAIMSTRNFWSAVLFKVVPIFLGILLLFLLLIRIGFIVFGLG